jgi:hypothetical protein
VDDPNNQQDQRGDSQNLGSIIDGLLAELPPELAEAARLGAISRWFDFDLQARMRPSDTPPSEVAEQLAQLRLLKKDAWGYFRYPSYLREHLLAWWQVNRPEEFARLNQLAQEYFQSLTEQAANFERPRFQREVLYHSLILDEATGLQQLRALFEDAHDRFQFGTAEDLVSLVSGLSAGLSESGREWLQYYSARLDLMYRRNELGQDAFKQLRQKAANPLVRAVAGWSLGRIGLQHDEWTRSIRLFQDSLEQLQAEGERVYSARVMLSLGDAYLDLARSSGGILAQVEAKYGRFNRFLHWGLHLPFVVYEYLLGRIGFLPDIFNPRTNYQDWIIAYLLARAGGWYRQAEKEFRGRVDEPGQITALFSLAEVELEKARWSRAKHYYDRLAKRAAVQSSPHRTARLYLGQGRVALAYNRPELATGRLEAAAGTFRRVRDLRSFAETQAQLGHMHTHLGDLDAAGTAYLASFNSLAQAEDHLTQTQVSWKLQDLLGEDSLGEEKAEEIKQAGDGLRERYYIARFPDTFLRRFRRLALLLVPSLTYVISIAIISTVIFSLTALETVIALSLSRADLSILTLTDALILAVGIALPLPLTLWLYQLLYGLVGMVAVRIWGRRLLPIQNEQPDLIVSEPSSLTVRNLGEETSRTLPWEEVTEIDQIEFKLWQRPIHLLSWIGLQTAAKPLRLDAITTGYGRLKEDLHAHLQGKIPSRKLDLVLLVNRWTLISIILAVLYASLVVFVVGSINITGELKTGGTVTLWFSSLLTVFLGTMLFLFPAVTMWNILAHRRLLNRAIGYREKSVPTWVVWIAALFTSLLTLSWCILLLVVS